MADAPHEPLPQQGNAPPPPPLTAAPFEPAPLVPTRTVLSKVLGLLLVIVCFEVGVFLMVFPWMEAWGTSSIPNWSPTLLDLWENNYFRGALSGLGVVNIWISFLEMLRLLRG